MATRQMNRLLIAGVVLVMGLVGLTTCSNDEPAYSSLTALPDYDTEGAVGDGDTTTDTIKALQAYAKAAVNKADDIHAATESRLQLILENEQRVARLQADHEQATAALNQTLASVDALEAQLAAVSRELSALQQTPQGDSDGFDANDLPVGFGFDDNGSVQAQGQWYEPADSMPDEEETRSGFSPLLRSLRQTQPTTVSQEASPPEPTVTPRYTLPKDTLLVDSVALTALIGRIPVRGQTPDPYPVKLFIGKDNLAANGHNIPEVEGMLFSGLGIGDWNLSCVSARLFSASFIFADGTIVNHSSDEPLGYISDPNGVPCIAGKFVTNAPAFLSQRIGLSAIGAAGAAYAEAQTQRDTSSLTGTTSTTVVGELDKLAAGQAVQSASDEVSQWLLERQQQSFDAVVVEPGVAVAIHLDQHLPIDYHSDARRIRYDTADVSTISALD